MNSLRPFGAPPSEREAVGRTHKGSLLEGAEAVKKYIFDSLSMKICDFHRICIHAARTHFVRALAWIAVFLHRNEFGTKIDLILFRPFGRNSTRFFDTLGSLLEGAVSEAD